MNKEKMSENNKEKINGIYRSSIKFYVVFFTAIFIGIFGILEPPIGSLDSNVLILSSVTIIASLAVLGINANFDFKEGKFKIDADHDGKNDCK